MYRYKVNIGSSNIEGTGVFADEEIKKDSVVWIYDPNHDLSISKGDLDILPEQEKTKLLRVAYLSKTSKKWIYPPKDDPANFTNHSESNNLSVVFDEKMSEEPFFKTNKDIRIGEELTVNYLEFDERTKDSGLDWQQVI